jgi:hypothetical protein
MNNSLRITLALPGVIDVDVKVSGIFPAAADHGTGSFTDDFVIDVLGEVVPTVPPHGRSER